MTNHEREAREILGREYQKAHAADPRINFCEPEFEVAVRAVMAALTRREAQQEAQGAVGEIAGGAFGVRYFACPEWDKLPVGTKFYTTAPVDVRVAAQALAARLRVIHDDPLYMAVWASAQNHGIDYRNGPKYDKELEALELALLDGQQAGVFKSCPCVSERQRELCPHKRECVVCTAALGGGGGRG